MAEATRQSAPRSASPSSCIAYSHTWPYNPNWPRLIVRELIDEQSRAREIASQYLKPLVDCGRVLMQQDIEAGRMRRVDPLQVIISITVETFGYFLLIPLLQGVGLEDPTSPANTAAHERMLVDLLTEGFGLSGPDMESEG